ncbi:MAG: glycerophosphodiester phosphodiesterase [Ilumatobacteraceae bacterium]
MPLHGTPRHPYLDHRLPIAFAHRGASGDHPENTMPAFQAAVDLGYRYLETDVQATADGVLVAFHDDDLQRTCGVEGKISELPWSEVQAARVDGEEPIPLFDELIEAFPEARFNIDCKSDAAAGPLTTALRRHRALERVCVGTFSHGRLTRLRRELGPGLCTSMSPWEVLRWRLGLVPRSVPVAQVPLGKGRFRSSPGGRSIAHRAGVQVHVWTVNEPEEMFRLLELGVDGIMTDRPAVLKQIMTSAASGSPDRETAFGRFGTVSGLGSTKRALSWSVGGGEARLGCAEVLGG